MARRHLDRSERNPLEQTREIKALRAQVDAGPADNSVTFAKLQDIATDRLIGRDTAGSGDPEEISVGNGLAFTGSAGIGIADDGVTNARLSNMAQDTIKGRITASTGDPEDLSGAQARTVLGLGTAATQNTGTSGANVPLLDGTNTWSAQQTLSAALNLTSGQIAFPATQNASSNANTLDDYEEGTWTPIVRFGGNSVGITYSSQLGGYTKVGNAVIITCQNIMTSKGSSTGAATLADLPFAPSIGCAANLWVQNFTGLTGAPTATITTGATVVQFRQSNAAGSGGTLTDAAVTNTAIIQLNTCYSV